MGVDIYDLLGGQLHLYWSFHSSKSICASEIVKSVSGSLLGRKDTSKCLETVDRIKYGVEIWVICEAWK
jgi:hypothetical protein